MLDTFAFMFGGLMLDSLWLIICGLVIKFFELLLPIWQTIVDFWKFCWINTVFFAETLLVWLIWIDTFAFSVDEFLVFVGLITSLFGLDYWVLCPNLFFNCVVSAESFIERLKDVIICELLSWVILDSKSLILSLTDFFSLVNFISLTLALYSSIFLSTSRKSDASSFWFFCFASSINCSLSYSSFFSAFF